MWRILDCQTQFFQEIHQKLDISGKIEREITHHPLFPTLHGENLKNIN